MSLVDTLSFIVKHPLNREHKAAALSRFAKWQIVSRLASGGVAVPFVDDTRLLVSRRMTGATGNIYCGLHEFEDMAFVLHVLRPGDLFVDIGANIGSYTVIAGGACGASVVAVEPIPTTHRHLVDNVFLNRLESRVRAENIGLGAAPGELKFSSTLDTVNHVLAQDEKAQAEAVSVPVETLDSLLAGAAPRVIKIDVEGFEAAVLEGAARTLASVQLAALIVELNGSGARYGFDDDAIHADLMKHGFRPFSYRPFSRSLEPLPGRNPVPGNTLYVRDLDFVSARVAQARRRLVNGVQI